MSPPLGFDVTTDYLLHKQESESRWARTDARMLKAEQDLQSHIQRTSGIWRDVRSLKWLVRLLIPLVIALAGAAPWVTKRVVVDVLTDTGVVRVVPVWQDR